MQRKLTLTVQINNCENHPLMVTADLNAEYDSGEGWNWEVERIKTVELVIGDKVGLDVTRLARADARAMAIIEAAVLNCNEQIYEALQKEEREVA